MASLTNPPGGSGPAGLNGPPAGGGAPAGPVRVLIVDDDPLVRAALSMIIGGAPDLVVVGEATDGTEVPAAVAAYAPDVVLMDIRMPRLDGLAATEELRSAPNPPAGHAAAVDRLDACLTTLAASLPDVAEITRSVKRLQQELLQRINTPEGQARATLCSSRRRARSRGRRRAW